jgi:hypothetical protein
MMESERKKMSECWKERTAGHTPLGAEPGVAGTDTLDDAPEENE